MGLASTRVLVYGGLLTAGAAVAWHLLAGPPKLHKGSKLFVVGDSLSLGLAPTLGQLAKDNGVAFRTMGVVGSRILNWYSNMGLEASLAEFKPDLILVSLGTNDAYLQNLNLPEYQLKLQKLLTNLRAHAPVAWIGPPTLPIKTDNGVRQMIQDNVPSHMYFHSENFLIPRSPDNLHPTVRGYAGWAGKLWEWVT